MSDRKIYIDQMSEKLKKMDDKIKELELKAKIKKDELKIEHNKNINDLRFKFDVAKQKFNNYKEVGKEALSELKQGTEESFKVLEESVANAIQKIK